MKIICIGRNYADHAKELNNAVPTEPVIFMKPDTALLRNKSDFYIPEFSQDIHFECELVVKISKEGKHIDPKFAHKYYDELSLGIDFTARDVQSALKAKGLPWELAKAFDNSAAIGEFVPKDTLAEIQNIEFQFFQNEVLKQNGHTQNMIFSVDTLIGFVSKYITLKKGDLIYTGTPEGVAAVAIGDVLVGKLGDESVLEINVR